MKRPPLTFGCHRAGMNFQSHSRPLVWNKIPVTDIRYRIRDYPVSITMRRVVELWEIACFLREDEKPRHLRPGYSGTGKTGITSGK